MPSPAFKRDAAKARSRVGWVELYETQQTIAINRWVEKRNPTYALVANRIDSAAGLRNFGYYGWYWRWHKIFLLLLVLSFALVLFAGDNNKVSVVHGIIIIIAAPSAIIFWSASLLFKKKCAS